MAGFTFGFAGAEIGVDTTNVSALNDADNEAAYQQALLEQQTALQIAAMNADSDSGFDWEILLYIIGGALILFLIIWLIL